MVSVSVLVSNELDGQISVLLFVYDFWGRDSITAEIVPVFNENKTCEDTLPDTQQDFYYLLIDYVCQLLYF